MPRALRLLAVELVKRPIRRTPRPGPGRPEPAQYLERDTDTTAALHEIDAQELKPAGIQPVVLVSASVVVGATVVAGSVVGTTAVPLK
jgi:hypothetical protein